MKVKKEKHGGWSFEYVTYDDGDIKHAKGLCTCGRHNWSEQKGGVGSWVTFPPSVIVDGATGNAGCYYRICKTCGMVKMIPISAL